VQQGKKMCEKETKDKMSEKEAKKEPDE